MTAVGGHNSLRKIEENGLDFQWLQLVSTRQRRCLRRPKPRERIEGSTGSGYPLLHHELKAPSLAIVALRHGCGTLVAFTSVVDVPHILRACYESQLTSSDMRAALQAVQQNGLLQIARSLALHSAREQQMGALGQAPAD